MIFLLDIMNVIYFFFLFNKYWIFSLLGFVLDIGGKVLNKIFKEIKF